MGYYSAEVNQKPEQSAAARLDGRGPEAAREGPVLNCRGTIFLGADDFPG